MVSVDPSELRGLVIPDDEWWDWLFDTVAAEYPGVFDEVFDGWCTKEDILANFQFRIWKDAPYSSYSSYSGSLYEWCHKIRPEIRACWITGKLVIKWFR